MRASVLSLLIVSACGRVGFGSDVDPDGAPPVDPAIDASRLDADVQPIVRVTGGRLIQPPASVVDGALESDDGPFVFVEREGAKLLDSVAVTFREPGIYTDGFDNTHEEWLGIGTEVTSVYVHADKIGNDNTPVDFLVELEVDAPILAVITASGLLSDSRPPLEIDQTLYPEGSGTLDSGTDVLTIAPDARSLVVDLRVTTGVDRLRVLLSKEI